MPRMIVTPLVLACLLIQPVLGQVSDPIRDKVTKARERFEASRQAIKQRILNELEQARSAAEKDGLKEDVAIYEAQRVEYERSGTLPVSIPTLPFRRELSRSAAVLKEAYGQAYASYQKAKDPKAADEFEAEWRVLEGTLVSRELLDVMIMPSAEAGRRAEWKYTTNVPALSWFMPRFDDSSWRVGTAGFGSRNPRVGTLWSSGQIWLRRRFSLPRTQRVGAPCLRLFHDEHVQVYLDGQLIWESKGQAYTTDYIEVPLSPGVRNALNRSKPHYLAVTCQNRGGSAFIDVGLVDRQPP